MPTFRCSNKFAKSEAPAPSHPADAGAGWGPAAFGRGPRAASSPCVSRSYRDMVPARAGPDSARDGPGTPAPGNRVVGGSARATEIRGGGLAAGGARAQT